MRRRANFEEELAQKSLLCSAAFSPPADGNYYVGEIKGGLSHGEGTATWADGGKYVGQYKNSLMHGEGTFTFADGAKYVGQYKDGQQHGLGKFTFADGEVYHDGEWENDEPKK